MKPRIAVLLLLLLFPVLLLGCDSNTAREEDQAKPVQEASTATEQEAGEDPRPNEDAQTSSGRGLVVIDGIVAPGEYEHEKTVAQVRVSWSTEGENLRMAMSAPGTGYVSIGFDPEIRKEGGNYIIGYVDGETVVVRDHVGTRGNLHEADTEQGGEDNILEYAGTEIDGRTTLEFIIPLDSGDAMDQPLTAGSRHVLLVAYQASRDDLISVHTRHGVAQIEL